MSGLFEVTVRRAAVLMALVVWGCFTTRPAAEAAEGQFVVSGVPVVLEDVTEEVEVRYQSMRLNRALNVWNVEVTVSNGGEAVVGGPVVLWVEDFSGTSGPVGADGTDDGDPARAYYDLSGWTEGGGLGPGQGSGARTLTLGVDEGSPRLTTRVFGRRAGAHTLATTRSLDEAGQPLPGVSLVIAGPAGAGEQTTDADTGVASFGQGPGEHVARFSAEGYLPVWRRQSLGENATTVVPNPRLTRRAGDMFAVSPLSGVVVSNASGGIRIEVPEGSVAQPATLRLTPLTGQNLPAFLPRGWSPLGAFWLESSSPLQVAANARIEPTGPIGGAETAALVRWDETALEWFVTQTLTGKGEGAVEVALGEAGAYALVVGDTGGFAPPAPQTGQALAPSVGSLPASDSLTATGTVTPPSSPASREAGLMTGMASVVLRHASERLPSGYLLRGEVTETYRLADGSVRLTPQYEHFIVGYQRPGDNDPFTLHARFPMRPVLLIGPDELEETTVRVDVLPEEAFDGEVLDDRGGQIAAGGVRLVAGIGRITAPSALRLRRLDATVFADLMGEGHEVVAAFDLTVDGSTVAGALIPQLNGAPADGLFVLARVLSGAGYFGLQPIARLGSDARGNLASLEPATGERLPGLRGAGQFVLVRVNGAQGMITGIARNGAGEVQANMPVELAGLPWMALTDGQGGYQLVSPAGEWGLGVRDPLTGDTGFAGITVTDPESVLASELATMPSGPRVARITPADGAARVSRVTGVVVEFNEAVDPATVAGSIRLLGPDESVVPSALTLNLANRVATLSPANELEAGTAYRVELAATIADPGGLMLEGQSEFGFTTMPLSERDPAAQLIIYEPGAMNVPPEVAAQIPAYTPGEDPFAIVVRGTGGTADPEVAVILANESTGETATVLSRPDGSFASVVSGTEEDFISATFVNQNGTRVYVPVSRQEFDNGFVGLYSQGGILEAQSDGGPVQVLIEPGAIPGKTRFKLDTLTLQQVFEEVRNTLPESGQLLGGFRYQIEGDELEQPADITFPVNLEALGLEPDELPEDRAFALCRAIEVDGETVYETLDAMHYEDGNLVTRSPPFPGPPHLNFLAIPVMMGFGTRTVLTGVAVGVPESAGIPSEAEIIAGVMAGGTPVRRVPGAVVSASPGAPQVGPLRGGAFVSKANSLGFFSFLYPINHFDPEPILLRAQDIRLPGVYGFTGIAGLGALAGPFAAQSANVVIRYPEGSAGDNTPPVLTAIPPLAVLPVGTNVTIDFLVRDNLSDPVVNSIAIDEGGSVALLTGQPLSPTNVVMTPGEAESLGPGRIRMPVEFNVKVPALVAVNVEAGDTSGNNRMFHLRFRFGTAPPVSDDNLPAGDPEDEEGPRILFTNPTDRVPVSEPWMTVRFNEPVDHGITNAAAVTVMPAVETHQELSPDQRELLIRFQLLEAGVEYAVTLEASMVKDLSGNFMEAMTPVTFRTPAVTSGVLEGVTRSGGVVTIGSYAFTADRVGFQGELLVHRVGDVEDAGVKGRLRLPFYPRAIEKVPSYDFKLSPEGAVETNRSLVVVAGGVTGAETIGQVMWVIDVTDPGNPTRIASEIIELDPTAAVTRMKWSAPNLVLSVLHPEFTVIESANLQAFLLGANGTHGVEYEFGLDANGDGDFVDEGDRLPIPERNTFFGLELALPLDDLASVQDFDVEGAGAFLVAAVRRPETGNYELQVITFNGQPVVFPGTTEGRVVISDGAAKRVLLDMALPVEAAEGVRFVPAAIVAVGSELRVYDLSDPVEPVLLNTISPGEDAANILTLARSGPDEYVAGTGDGIHVIQRSLMSRPQGGHAVAEAVVGYYAGAVYGHAFGATDLEVVTAGTGSPVMINRAPRIQVVQFPSRSITSAEDLINSGETHIRDYLDNLVESPFLLPYLIDRCDPEALHPATNSGVHHYGLIRASGAAGPSFRLSLESLDDSGRLKPPPGKDYGPVFLSEQAAGLGVDTAQPEVSALVARRLSDNPLSDLYSTYLTDPFVVVAAPLTEGEVEEIEGSHNRRYLWSGNHVRAAIDPPQNGNPPLEVWTGRIENRVYTPGISRTYAALAPEYLDNPNPSFARAAPRIAGVDLQSGEYRQAETDVFVEGRELDLVLTRVYESRGRYAGLFGRGWDFSLNIRLRILEETVLPPTFQVSAGVMSGECVEAGPGDVILYDGAGGVHYFRRISADNANEDQESIYSGDPAIQEFLGESGADRIRDYYESPEGFFTVLFGFRDGTFMTVGPTGIRMFFDGTGRIMKLKGTSEEAELVWAYREDGKLDTVEGDRGLKLEFGYYLPFPGSDFQSVDVASDKAWERGKIARVRVDPSLANASEAEYLYSEDGNLERVRPKAGAETICQYDANDLNLMVAVGREDGTGLPGQAITYEGGRVVAVARDGVSTSFGGSVETAADRFEAGSSEVTATTGANTVVIPIDARGRPTEFGNRPFEADDAGRPTLVANAETEARLVYDEENPVYRFRGNLIRTERRTGGGDFVSSTEYDGSAWNRPRKITDVNGVETEIDHEGGSITETIGPVTRTVVLNEYGQMEREENTEGITLARRERVSIAGLSPDGGLMVGGNADGMAESVTSRDSLGRVASVQSGGRSYTIGYNDDGQPVSIAGGNVPTVSMEYTDGLLTMDSVSAGGKNVRNTYAYDETHGTSIKTLTAEETGLPVTATGYEYDDEGRVVAMTTAGEETIFTWDGIQQTGVRGPGVSREATYEDSRLMMLTEQGVGMTFVYDGAGRLESQSSQGAVTRFTYDDGDSLAERLKTRVIEDELFGGTVLEETYTYDGAGRVATVVSQGRTRTMSYFADGVIRTIQVGGQIVKEVTRDQAGRVLSSRLNDVTYEYSGHDTVFGLPAQEKVVFEVSGFELTRQNSYDVQGRLNGITLPAGTVGFTHDGFGHLNTTTDPDGVARGKTYSPGGLALDTTFADGDTATYTYNARRRPERIEAGEYAQAFGYDSEGMVNRITYPDGAESRFEQRNEFFEAERITHGDVVQNLSWEDGRLRSISIQDKGDLMEYERDGLGRLREATLNGRSVEFQYDPRGLMHREVTEGGAWSAGFDNLNRLVTETYPSGLTISFGPDTFGFPTTAGGAGVDTATWVGGGLLDTVTYLEGLKVQRHYDASLRVERLTYSVGPGQGTVIAGFDYGLSAGGRIEEEEALHTGRFEVFRRNEAAEGMRIVEFAHGAMNRAGGGALFSLTGLEFTDGELRGPAQGSVADPRGFLPAMTFFGQRLATVDGEAVLHDSFGSVTNVPLWVRLPGQGSLTRVMAALEYDGLGMLRGVNRADGVTVTYARDGMGRIVERGVEGDPSRCRPGTWEYRWRGNQLIEELEASGGQALLVRRYLYLDRYLINVQAASEPGGTLEDHVPMLSLNGSVRGYLTPSGEVVERIEYSAYGMPVFHVAGDDVAAGGSSVGNTLMFHGAWFDEATGLYQMGQRNLHPLLGRFLQRDNVLYSQSRALFTAFDGDPAGRLDPFGTDSDTANNLFGGLNLAEIKRKAQDLGEAYKSYDKGMAEYKRGDTGTTLGLGSAGIDLLGKVANLGALSPEQDLRKDAEQHVAIAGAVKAGLDAMNAIHGIRTERNSLAAVTASSWATIQANFPKIKSIRQEGAGVSQSFLSELDRRFAKDKLRVFQTASEFNAREAFSGLRQKQRDYLDKREENLLSLGKGVNTLAKFYMSQAYANDESHAVRVANQGMEVADKVFNFADAYRKARKADSLKLMFQTQKSHGSALLTKPGRSAVSAAYSLGFEAGKLIAMAVSDPDVAQAYSEQVKQFEEDGGWLTVAGGVLSTFGADEAAYAIQQYSDWNATDLIRPILEERDRNLRRTEFYLNGLSAP